MIPGNWQKEVTHLYFTKHQFLEWRVVWVVKELNPPAWKQRFFMMGYTVLTLCPHGNFHAFLTSANFFFQNHFFFQKSLSGSRSGLTFCRAQSGSNLFCKSYQQTTLVGRVNINKQIQRIYVPHHFMFVFEV